MIRRLASLVTGVQNLVLRARRGWAPRDAWAVDEHLCAVAGGMLRHLATTAHAWPSSAEFETFDDWATAVAMRADALIAYSAEEETTHAPAKEALHWVADHLIHLWD